MCGLSSAILATPDHNRGAVQQRPRPNHTRDPLETARPSYYCLLSTMCWRLISPIAGQVLLMEAGVGPVRTSRVKLVALLRSRDRPYARSKQERWKALKPQWPNKPISPHLQAYEQHRCRSWSRNDGKATERSGHVGGTGWHGQVRLPIPPAAAARPTRLWHTASSPFSRENIIADGHGHG